MPATACSACTSLLQRVRSLALGVAALVLSGCTPPPQLANPELCPREVLRPAQQTGHAPARQLPTSEVREALKLGGGGSSAMRALVTRDSAAVLAALTLLATDPSLSSDLEADAAARAYRDLGGDASPILAELLVGRDEYRVIGLAAISRLDQQEERTVVALFACQAAWLIRAAAEDDSYINELPLELRPAWVRRARYEFDEAERLLGEDDPVISALRGSVEKAERQLLES